MGLTKLWYSDKGCNLVLILLEFQLSLEVYAALRGY